MRTSSRAIIFKEKSVLLIYRERDNEKYYVFPGGKIESNENKEECIIRECKEELGIKIKVQKYVYEVKGTDFVQQFFLCEWVDGKIGTGDKEEYSANRKGGIQVPQLISIDYLLDLNIVSPQIVNQLITDINDFGLILDIKTKQIIENEK